MDGIEDASLRALAKLEQVLPRLRHRVRALSAATVPIVWPHRLVAAGRRWYLVAFDTDRDDWRIVRGPDA